MPTTCYRTPPELKKTKLQVIQTKLLYSFQHHCDGELHRISIDRDGRVILHNHDKTEVRNWINMTKLGGTAVGCVDFLHGWASGAIGKSTVDRTLSRHILARGGVQGMAVGIWHKKNHKRRNEVIQYYDGSKDQKTSILINIFGKVKDLLCKRGLRACRTIVNGHHDSQQIKITGDNGVDYVVLNGHIHGHGYVAVNVGTHGAYGKQSTYSVLKDEQKKIPITAFADLAERWYYLDYCDAICKRNQARENVPFKAQIKALEGVVVFPKLMVTEMPDHKALVKVDLHLPSLTIQGARQIVQELNKISDKINNIAAATKKREASPHRVPGPEGVGIGDFDESSRLGL